MRTKDGTRVPILSRASWSNVMGYIIIVSLIVAGFIFIDGRRNSSSDVGRQILCTGIIANVGNVARDDPFVVAECRKVGVDRADYPPTDK